MKKFVIISFGLLVISSIIVIIYMYNLLSEAINDTDTYHAPVSAPIIPKESINIHLSQ